MLIHIKSFNGFNLASTSFKATGIAMRNQSDAAPVFIEQANAEAMDSGAYSLGIRSIPLHVKILDYANRHALSAQLREALKPGTSGILLATFSDEGRDYQIECRVQSIVPDQTYWNQYTVILQTGSNCWISVNELTSDWAVTASGDEKEITVGGYSETRLSINLTAAELPATGWAFQQLYQLVNPLIYAYGRRPWCLTLDTAALVTAGKMQADCDDLVVVIDGVISRRWLADPNTDHTKIWFNVDLLAGQELSLKTAIAASGTLTEIAFDITSTNKKIMGIIPVRGILYDGTEWIEYNGKDINNCKVFLPKRGAFGTTLQAHNAGVKFRWIQHTIHVLYGNSAAVAPASLDDSYDDEKPIFDLAASTNASWVYTAATGFYDAVKPLRTGAWKPTILKSGTESEYYLITGNAESGNPAMGMKIASWWKGTKLTNDNVTVAWVMSCPGLMNLNSATVRKYRSHTQWPATKAFRLDRSNDQKNWYEVWNEATPTAAATWQSVTKASQAITPAMGHVRFVLIGNMPAVADIQAMAEILTCTVEFVSANLPVGTLLGEKTNYLLDVVITNEASGDAIRLIYPMLLDVAMDVDGEEFTVTYGDANAHSALSLDDDSRDLWLRLNPGINTLVITGNDVGTLDVVLRWRERRR